MDAEKADKLIESGLMTEAELATQKPFLGVPISTKDCIRVKDMLNTSGLYHRRDVRGKTDSDVMGRMRKAGAIPFALTNVSECCKCFCFDINCLSKKKWTIMNKANLKSVDD